MGVSALGMQAAGAGMAAGGAYAQAQTQSGVLNYEATIAGNNAIIAQYQAGIAKDVGAQQVQTSEMKNAAVLGEQRAGMAANGVDLGTGSATDVLTSTKYIGERDALTIQDNTNRQVWSDEIQAQNFKNEDSADRAMASSIHPGMAMFSSLLTGASGVNNSYNSLKRAGSI